MYNKQDAINLGHAMGDLVNGIRGDGVGVGDFGNLISTLTAAASAMNEMQEVPEASAEHILGAMADKLGDYALAKVSPPPVA